MPSKLSEVVFKQIGQNLNVSIDGTPFTIKGDKETLAPVRELLTKYKEKPTAALLKSIMTAVKPATTAKKEEKAKKVEAVKADIKKTKKEIKAEAPKGKAKAKPAPVAEVKETKPIASVVGAVKTAAQKAAAKAVKAPENKLSLKEMQEAIGSGKYSDKELAEMEALIAKSKKVKTPEPAKATTGRRGEH